MEFGEINVQEKSYGILQLRLKAEIEWYQFHSLYISIGKIH